MWLANQINPFKYSYVNRFDLIVAIAKAMRGNHFFYISAETGSLYAVPEEPYAIREVILPQELRTDVSFVFRIDTLDPDILERHINFVIFHDMPWALIPATQVDKAIDYSPFFKPVSDTRVWTILNTMTRSEVEFLDLYGPDGKKSTLLPKAMDVFRNFFSSRSLISQQGYVFPSMERSTILQDAFANKATMGEQFLSLQYDNKDFSIFLFKNLFSFNKNDKVWIEGRDRIDNPNLFELKITVTHDKNPIKYIIPGDFVENTYCSFFRLT